MPIAKCLVCGGAYHWKWEDAFDKFGFDDGDGQVMTDDVASVLSAAGYSVVAEPWGLHNVVILSIKTVEGIEQIPGTAEVGYDSPRDFLPEAIVHLLDRAFSARTESSGQMDLLSDLGCERSPSSNAIRAVWAAAAVAAFVQQTGCDQGAECLSDMIADLGHHADIQGYDFLAIIERAIGHWACERANPLGFAPAPRVTITIHDGGAL